MLNIEYKCEYCGKYYNIRDLVFLCGSSKDGSEDEFWCKPCYKKATHKVKKNNKTHTTKEK